MRTHNSKASGSSTLAPPARAGVSQLTNLPTLAPPARAGVSQTGNRRKLKLAHRLIGALAHCHRDESGQDLVEWTVGLPVFMILCAGIVFYAWMWWNQVAAAAAVHDGTYLAAIRGGDTGAGYARTQRMLRSAVGGFASSYSITIGADASRRSVSGSVRNSSLFSLPYLGALPLNIQAQSFQRLEQFYGGPPNGWW